MRAVSEDVLSHHLKPLCPRDNHVMKYESRGLRFFADDQTSYHCGFEGCSVRYDSADGYYTLLAIDDHAYRLEEPGVNTLKCPRHNSWLYRKEDFGANLGVRWCCGVDGCDYFFNAPNKGDWVRT
jgi:hypothetical protein